MGLFSSIKKGLSKAWKGVKKAVKGVAKGVKKVAKRVITATPWGKKIWELGSKAWKGIKKGIGKIATKLGPVGMMALSFVLAPVVGPALGAMWSSFGAGAAAMATSANAFVATLGSVGNGIFAAGNFIGGTLGAMGNAVSQGASNVMAGNFSGAVSSFASNMSAAFTGQAGMAAVNAGAAQAVVGSGISAAEATAELAANTASNLTAEQLANQTAMGIAPGQAAQDAAFSALNSSPVGIDVAGLTAEQVANNAAMGNFSTAVLDQQVAQYGMTAAQLQAIPDAASAFASNGAAGARAVAGNVPGALQEPSSWDQSKVNADKVKSLLGGGSDVGGYQPYMPQAIKAQGVGNSSEVQGQGSAGFSLLGGVEGLEESLRRSQGLMFG